MCVQMADPANSIKATLNAALILTSSPTASLLSFAFPPSLTLPSSFSLPVEHPPLVQLEVWGAFYVV